jgi:hypothetical protein
VNVFFDSEPTQFGVNNVATAAAADESEDLVTLAEQKLRQIRAILARNTGDQCTLHVRCLFLIDRISGFSEGPGHPSTELGKPAEPYAVLIDTLSKAKGKTHTDSAQNGIPWLCLRLAVAAAEQIVEIDQELGDPDGALQVIECQAPDLADKCTLLFCIFGGKGFEASGTAGVNDNIGWCDSLDQ